MWDILNNFFSAENFIPHGHCYLWKPGLVWMHLLSDLLIGIAYYSIPATLIYFVGKRQDLPFRSMFGLFGAFIVSCGTTHFMAVWTLWHPIYWVSGLLKAITAVVSLYTALALVPLIPLALALPSPAELEKINLTLHKEIQERKLAEAELQKRTQMLDFANDTIIIRNLDDTITYWNQGAARLYGWEKEEILGKHVHTFLQTIFPKPLEEILEECLQNGYWEGELTHVKRDRTQIIVASRWTLQRDEHLNPVAILEINNNITERKLALSALQRREQELKTLVENAPDGIIRLDLQLRHLYINPAVERDIGIPARNIIGKTLSEAGFPEKIVNFWETRFQKVIATGEMSIVEFNYLGVNKQEFFQARIVPEFALDGSVESLLMISRGINELKQAEEALRKANQELEIRVKERTAFLSEINASLLVEMKERKHAEAALRQSEQRYRSLVIATAEVVWLCDAEGRVVDLSQSWQVMTGQTEEEHKGWGWVNAIHPEDRERTRQLWKEAIATKTFYKNHYRLRTKNGSYRDFAVRGVPVLEADGRIREWVGICSDITSRKQAEQALQKSEELYRTLARNFPNGVVILFDQDLRYTLAEGQDIAASGLSKAELEGKTIWELFPPETCATLEPLYKAALAGEAKVSEISYGEKTYNLHTLPVKNDGGEISAGMAMTQDITVQKQAEKALKNSRDVLEASVKKRTKELTAANAALREEISQRLQTQAKLEQLATELKRSNQELEQFAYVASHDLQEPLRAIGGYTQLLMQEYQERLDESATEYMSYIVDGSTRMQQLIQDLLAYSRVGSCSQEFAPTDCNAVVEQAIANLQVAIAESKAIITHDFLPTAIADKTLLMQVFQNLIGNAIKFCRQQSPQVHIAAELRNNEWLFWVRDNGIGIKPQYLERIFVIFKRLHTRREFSGTGIGLAICKKIVERHQGRIWAESQLGTGTTFYFTIPNRPSNEEL
jgi:PAS domain S-box-containing protein